MRCIPLCCLMLVLCGCADRNVQPVSSASAVAPPELIGVVTDASGQPLTGVDVKVYSGLATYFHLADTQTDEHGVFRLPIRSGAMLLGEGGQPARYSIGLRLEAGGIFEPEGGLHWTGLIPIEPNEVRVRFRVTDRRVEALKDDA